MMFPMSLLYHGKKRMQGFRKKSFAARGVCKTDLFSGSLAEDEEDGAAEAEGRPDEVEAEFFAHEEHGERHED